MDMQRHSYYLRTYKRYYKDYKMHSMNIKPYIRYTTAFFNMIPKFGASYTVTALQPHFYLFCVQIEEVVAERKPGKSEEKQRNIFHNVYLQTCT
jgi:hypothetical protein